MKEVFPSAPVPQKSNEPEDPGRRAFFKKAGALGVAAIAGSLLPEDAEAWGRNKVTQEQIGSTSVEYHNFKPSPHESTLIGIKLKQSLPGAVSVQFSFDTPTRHINNEVLTQMYLNAIMGDGSIVVCRGDLRDRQNNSGNLAEKITNLFENLEAGNGRQKKNGMERVYSVGNPN